MIACFVPCVGSLSWLSFFLLPSLFLVLVYCFSPVFAPCDYCRSAPTGFKLDPHAPEWLSWDTRAEHLQKCDSQYRTQCIRSPSLVTSHIEVATANTEDVTAHTSPVHHVWNSPHRGGNSPHSTRTACIDDVTAHIKDASAHIAPVQHVRML